MTRADINMAKTNYRPAPDRCVLCGAEQVGLKWQRLGYTMYECKTCEAVFVWPLPTAEELAAFYGSKFFQAGQDTGYLDYEREQPWRRRNYLADAARLQRFVAGGRILDVGCATGHFLDVCPASWEKHGVEVSEYAALAAQKKYGDRIRIGSLQEVSLPENYFDAVVLWETINHVPDPAGDLKRIHSVLKPGGILALSVGDVRSRFARVMGKYWYQVTPPLHLYHFSVKTFRVLLERIGFDIVTVEHTGKYGDLSACLYRAADALNSPRIQSWIRKLSAHAWARPVVYVNLWDTMTLYARKR